MVEIFGYKLFSKSTNLLGHSSRFDWNVVEQSHYVEAGQTHIQDHQLRFYKTIEECLVENEPNVILLSSVLQYLEDPLYLIKKFSASKATCLIIDRTPFSSSECRQATCSKGFSAYLFCKLSDMDFFYVKILADSRALLVLNCGVSES